MKNKVIKNIVSFALALAIIFGVGGAGLLVYDTFIKETSVYALSKLGSSGSEVRKSNKNFNRSDITTARLTEFTARQLKKP